MVLLAGASLIGLGVVSQAAAQGLQTQPPPTASPNPSSGQAPETSVPVAPGTPSSPAVAEVVVTAQRRSENLQNVPVAVTALSGASLSTKGISNTAELSQAVPSLNFTTSVGAFGLPTIRGVGAQSAGPGLENSVATYIDGVYIVTSAGALLSLHDISQVAVLKGPQGTLFGRNATGGLIQVTTLDPTTQPKLDIDGSIGDRAYSAEDLYVSGPLIGDKLLGAFTVSNDDLLQGYGHNAFNGDKTQTHRSTSMRGKLLWKPDAHTQIRLSLDYSKYKSSDPVVQPEGVFPDLPPRDIDQDASPQTHVEQWGLNLNIRHDFNGFQLVSTSAYRQTDTHLFFDADGTPFPATNLDLDQRDSQTSQELQFLSTTKGPFSWVAGAYYLHARGAYDPVTNLLPSTDGGAAIVTNTLEDLDSYSLFGQATYKIDPATDLTAGIRYTLDHRSILASEDFSLPAASVPIAAPLNAAKDFSAPTARVSLDHRFSPELLAYISYNRGFKSGTFAPQSFPLVVVQPETLNAYEIGAKTDLLDRRLRFNIAGYYYDYSNKQSDVQGNGIQLLFDAQKAQMYGLDADLTARITNNLQFAAGLGLLHGTYTKFTQGPVTQLLTPLSGTLTTGDDSGKYLENAPKFTLNLGPSYTLPTPVGKFTGSINYYHNSGFFADADNQLRQGAYSVVNADVLFVPTARPELTVDVWAKNLTDAKYASELIESVFGYSRVLSPGELYGFTVGLHF